MEIELDKLYLFIQKAGRSTYASSGVESITYDKNGFKELNFTEGDYTYKDSYAGFFKSRGMEIVTYKNQPVWTMSYGGGMLEENEELALQTFGFLKKAFLTDEPKFQTFRGPSSLKEGDWEYSYKQDGDIKEFSGYEEISFKGKRVFFHRTIGGLVVNK